MPALFHMRKLLIKYTLPLAAVLSAVFTSCSDEGPDNRPDQPLKVSRSTILVGGGASEVDMTIFLSSGEWTLSGYENWCAPSSGSGSKGITRVTVAFTENDDEDPRETVFEITGAGTTARVSVKQLAKGQAVQPPGINKEYSVNETVFRDVFSKWYYWDKEVANTQADFNQDYDQFCRNYLSVLKDNTADGRIWSTINERYLYSYVDRFPSGTPRVPLNFGIDFDISILEGDKYVLRLLYVTPGSPAAKAGLKRGDWIRRIDGRIIGDRGYNKRLVDSLGWPVHGGPLTLQVVERRYDGNIELNNQRDIEVSPERFVGTPFLQPVNATDKLSYQIIDQTTRENTTVSTGYLVYNSFDPAYEQQLIQTFQRFNAHTRNGETVGIDNLVLDLRYCKTGSVEMAELMGNLIAPESIRGQIFAKYIFNEQQSSHNRTATFEPHEHSVGVDKLIVIATRHTAGAAELLINAFNGVDGVKMILVGGVTEGMSTGMVRFRDAAELGEYVYDAYPLAFKCRNASMSDTDDYNYGITPHAPIDEWTDANIVWPPEFTYVSTAKYKDAFLVRALQYAVGSLDPPANPAQFQISGNIPAYPKLFPVRPTMTMDTIEP